MISEIYILFFKASLTIRHTATVSQKKSGTSKKIQWDFQISRAGSLDFLDLKVNGSPVITPLITQIWSENRLELNKTQVLPTTQKSPWKYLAKKMMWIISTLPPFHHAGLNKFWVMLGYICFCNILNISNTIAATIFMWQWTKMTCILSTLPSVHIPSIIKLAWIVFELSQDPYVFVTFWLFL